MLVHISTSSLKESRWYEYAIRFVLGGAAAIFTGVVGKWLGPSVGGLFLSLPAIFCASATLIESHEIHRKREAGQDGRRRGQKVAALEAAGAVLGSIGMLAFAAAFYILVQRSALGAFLAASLAWLIAAVAAWYARRNIRSVRNPC
jgi:Protein of unknown function (DUF3147)